MPFVLTERLLRSFEIGTAQMRMFVEQIRNTTNTQFCESLSNLKINTVASLVKKKTVKLVDEKVLTSNADHERFGRLVIGAKSRDINLKDVLSYELSAVPFALVHTDGSLRKTNKSVLMAELEKKVDVRLKLPQVITSMVWYGMVFIHSTSAYIVHSTDNT